MPDTDPPPTDDENSTWNRNSPNRRDTGNTPNESNSYPATERDTNLPTERWLGEPVLEAELPADLQAALSDVLDGASVQTLGAWIAEIRRLSGGGSIELEDLCHTDRQTGHWGELDGDRYDFLCFYDAVILSALAQRPVHIRTESPTGEVIEARAEGTDTLSVTPEGAVFSFGINPKAIEHSGDGGFSHEALYAAVCPYVRAFESPGAYEEWAADSPATTVALSLSGATEVAAALVA